MYNESVNANEDEDDDKEGSVLLYLYPEIWLQILKLLGTRDLCNLMLSCRTLNNLGANPTLWADARLNKWLVWRGGGLPFLGFERFARIKTIDLSETDLSTLSANQLLAGLPKHQHIININLSFINLSSVDEDLLENLGGLKCISLQQTRLSTSQATRIFRVAARSQRLETLNLGRVDLSQVDACTLVDGICNIKRVNVNNTGISMEQSNLLFLRLQTTTPNLQHLLVRGVNLATTNPKVMADGVSGLVSISLQETGLGTSQTRAIFKRLGSDPSRLRSINLSQVDLSPVYEDYLGRGIVGLRKATLRCCHLTAPQLTRILQQSENISLDLQGNNFQGVPLNLLVRFQMQSCFTKYLENSES